MNQQNPKVKNNSPLIVALVFLICLTITIFALFMLDNFNIILLVMGVISIGSIIGLNRIIKKLKNKEYNPNRKIKLQKADIPSIIVLFLILCMYTFMGITGFKEALGQKDILTILYYGLPILIYLIPLIFLIVGVFKANMNIHKENKFDKNINLETYFRELPNSFGIGLASLLCDFTMENKKDIIAVILDLCARKYLSLEKRGEKYYIRVTNQREDKIFLKNESYILSMIKKGEIRNINYEVWCQHCLEDGICIGLFKYPKNKIKNHENLFWDKSSNSSQVSQLIIAILIALGSFLFCLLTGKSIYSAFIISLFIVILVPFLINYVSLLIILSRHFFKQTYDEIIDNTVVRTSKGSEELQKLNAFRAFLKDFGYFVDKQPEEVVLWDRYLSYAQVFGLTKEIMKSGYKQLVENASFHIDSIDNISLDNIELEQ